MADNRGAVYREGNKWVVRGSALGSCLRGLVAECQGYEPLPFDERTLTVFAEGNLHEDAVVNTLKEEGWDIWGQQDELEIPVGKHILIRFHLDGRGKKVDSDEWGIEIKSMSDDVFKKWEKDGWKAFDRYAWQVSTYMAGTGLPFLFVTKNRNNGVVTKTEVRNPPYGIAAVKARAASIVTWAEKGELPVCDVDNGFRCPFVYLHEQPEMFPEQADAEVEALGISLAKARVVRKQAEAVERETRERLVDRMGDANKLATPRVSITRFTQNRDGGIEYDRFAADHPTINLGEYRRKIEVTQVRVTLRDEGDD